eukprot:CAMPEP_0177185408 /NCGR_PEP_ID=MMETSP0367-20130122/18086_1 /TAXON_ID=447022 ORGANISM="Scrippsiella hangoei-like, Strain SHHI-4" /NCGR_SAMPLE_ID=MMETSP0367 /ASSEMBLY_ACC=CAM_ASM_000362 /LENGTH=164 /DNA_ID=CAMNT_0018632611 /DNA_START=47 /DNA_END=538 /DNA_ORIENTATION=-
MSRAMIKTKAHHVHLQTNEQTSNWPRGIGCNRAPGRAHAALASCIFFACAARKLLAANLAFWVTSLGSPAAFLFVPLVAEAAEEPEQAGLAHRSLRDPATASPAVGKILTKSLSKTLTLMAVPDLAAKLGFGHHDLEALGRGRDRLQPHLLHLRQPSAAVRHPM